MALSDSAGIGSALPSQVGNSGLYLTTDGTVATWATVTGGGGVDTLAAVGSSPNADGASIASTTLTLQPADGTHPGVVTAGAQTIGGLKLFSAGVGTGAAGATHGFLGVVSGFPALWLGTPADSPASATYTIGAATNTYINAQTGGDILFSVNNGLYWTIDHLTGHWVGAGVGSGLQLKSPDGTVYTATIANGGTWTIT